MAKDSKPPLDPKTLPIAAVISVLVLGGMFGGAALFIVDRADAAERQAVTRCRAIVEAERHRYASPTQVAELGAKIDAMNQRIGGLGEDLREFRTETRAALRARPSSRPRRSP